MVLVDSSVWINHFRKSDPQLTRLLSQELVLTHPFIIGELACGNLGNRKEIISLLCALPSVLKATDAELLFFIDEHRVMGKGLGLIDIHLLASAKLAVCALWTDDLRLKRIADLLKIQEKED